MLCRYEVSVNRLTRSKAYIATPGDHIGRPDRVLDGRNPPQSPVSRGRHLPLSNAKLWTVARRRNLLPLLTNGETEKEKLQTQKLVLRCIPGGPPPRKWLQHCAMGPIVLACLQQ